MAGSFCVISSKRATSSGKTAKVRRGVLESQRFNVKGRSAPPSFILSPESSGFCRLPFRQAHSLRTILVQAQTTNKPRLICRGTKRFSISLNRSNQQHDPSTNLFPSAWSIDYFGVASVAEGKWARDTGICPIQTPYVKIREEGVYKSRSYPTSLT